MKNKSKTANPSVSKENHIQQRTRVGNITGGKGFAIGTGAKAIVVEIGSIFNLEILFIYIKKYWLFLLINILLQFLVFVVWLSYKDRFLIPAYILGLGAIFLETSIVAGAGLITRSKPRLFFILIMVISTVLWGGLTTSEIHRIFYPPKFLPEDFGVAVAQFGEGPDLTNTLQAREVSQLVLLQLIKQVQEDPTLSFVKFKPIGLIRTQEEAWADGSRLGADLVIWGQLQESEDQTILSFSILETPDKVSNPMFARVLPLYEIAAASFLKIEGRHSDEIATGTTTISSFTFGLAHFFKWDFMAATEAFEKALADSSINQDDSYHYLIYFYYGLSLQRLQRLEAANQIFEKAIQIHPDDPAPWLARAWGNKSLGKLNEAQHDASVAWDLCSIQIHLKPDYYVPYFDRAQANEILENWDGALVDYETTKEKAPDLYIAYIGIDRILIIQNRLTEAVQTIQEAINLAESKNANPAWAYVYLAHVQELRKDPIQARIAFEKAVSLAPEVEYMHFRWAQFLESTGDPKDLIVAESEYKTSIIVSNYKTSAYADLARFYAKHGRLDEALQEYQFAIQYDRQAVGIWTELAELLAQLNRSDEARATYEHAIELDPGNLYSYLSFGNFLYNQGEYESAIKEWKSASQIDPSNCGISLNLGQAYELLGDQEQAKIFYREVINNEIERSQECREEAIRRLNSFAK